MSGVHLENKMKMNSSHVVTNRKTEFLLRKKVTSRPQLFRLFYWAIFTEIYSLYIQETIDI